jgi:hypothetical protein
MSFGEDVMHRIAEADNDCRNIAISLIDSAQQKNVEDSFQLRGDGVLVISGSV